MARLGQNMQLWKRFSLLGLTAFLGVFSCSRTNSYLNSNLNSNATQHEPEPLTAAGLENLFRLSDRLFSGGSPEGEQGFAELKRLGVKTVISVDGARPDFATAKKFGLRYVHLPVGYDGIHRERILELARATRDLPGAVYIHCHHGKHRGPAAVAVVQLCLDSTLTPGQAEHWMQTAGTDPKFSGLIALPKSLVRPTTAELNRIPGAWTNQAEVSTLTKTMVEMDARNDQLKKAHKTGWNTGNRSEPDASSSAGYLAELFREAQRIPHQHGPEFTQLLEQNEKLATELAVALRQGDTNGSNTAYQHCQSLCTHCHQRFRDTTK
jgi:protein tyrosine phosphatase (PTP) superfamily phosphohydrolase (DUF442 family)